jgi:hypothetical protein
MTYKRHPRLKHMRDLALGYSEEKNEVDEKDEAIDRGRRNTLAPPERFSNPHETSGVRSRSGGSQYASSRRSGANSIISLDAVNAWSSQEDEGEQDIQEVWFPGCHAVSLQTFLYTVTNN